MKATKFFIIALSALSLSAFGQEASVKKETVISTEGPVKWMTWDEAVTRSKTEKRKIFIDVYTDWCGWCKVMDKNTFSEPNIAKLLNEEFYAVKFDAEQTEDVTFNGTTFKFIPQGNRGVHQLAAALLNNQMSYPTVVFLDENFGMISPVPGYQKPEQFHVSLSYVASDAFKKGIKIDDYVKTQYKSPFTQPKENGGK